MVQCTVRKLMQRIWLTRFLPLYRLVIDSDVRQDRARQAVALDTASALPLFRSPTPGPQRGGPRWNGVDSGRCVPRVSNGGGGGATAAPAPAPWGCHGRGTAKGGRDTSANGRRGGNGGGSGGGRRQCRHRAVVGGLMPAPRTQRRTGMHGTGQDGYCGGRLARGRRVARRPTATGAHVVSQRVKRVRGVIRLCHGGQPQPPIGQ